jgi:N-dimethylarginine dimethylaminohydrolase
MAAPTWQGLGYSGGPDLRTAVRQYDAFVDLVRAEVPSVERLDADAGTSLDSIYAYDPVIVTSRGLIHCRMAKPQRRGEPDATGARPILRATDG